MVNAIQVGYGAAKGEDAFDVGVRAMQQALAGIDVHPLALVLVFASARYDLEALLAGIHSVAGDAPLVGTTTAGEICNGPQQESVVLAALASPHLQVHIGIGQGVSQDWRRAVAQATAVVPCFSAEGSGVWSELTRQGKTAFALLFSPGNTCQADSRSYEILQELKRLSQGLLPIFGGSSADDWRMQANYVLWGRRAYPDSLLIAVLETRLCFGMGLAHGFSPGSQQATITRVRGHEVLELDGEPAAEVYARWLGARPEALRNKHLTLTTSKPVGIPGPYHQYSINVASYCTPQGGVRFGQPVTKGVVLTLMQSEPDDLIAAGREALQKSLLRGDIKDPALVLAFSCALRFHFLGERVVEETAAMRDVTPNAPLLGFYSFGGQGLTDDGVNQHSNGVITVLVLGRELSFAAQVALENERLQQDLSESERRFRTLVGSMDDVIFTLDHQQRHTGVFGRWLEKAGLTPEVFMGKTSREILDPQAAVVHEAANVRALAGENVAYEWSLVGADGVRYYQTLLSPMRDAQENVVGIVGVGRDITERKRMEQRIERLNRLKEGLLGPGELEQKLKCITDGIVDIFEADFARIWLVQPGDLCDQGCFHATSLDKVHLCRRRDRCLGLAASSGRYTHLDGQVHRRVPFGRYKTGCIASGEEIKFITNDVTRAPRVHDQDWASELGLTSFAGYRLLSADGQPLGVLALFSQHKISHDEDALLEGLANTTAQVIQVAYAEKALREREQFLALLNEITLSVLKMTDLPTILQMLANRLGGLFGADGCYITLWDEAAQATIPTAACGQWRETYQSMQINPQEMTLTRSVLAAGRLLLIKDVYDTPYLSPRIASLFPARSVLALPIIAGEQKLGAALVTFNEPQYFTREQVVRGEQVAGQIALAVAKAQLVQELQAHIAELQARNEELDAFAHTVAHDLKGPLSYIVGFAEALGQDCGALPEDEQRRYLNTIAHSGRKAGRIVDELLLLAQARKLQVKTEPLDMASIVQSALKRLMHIVVKRQAEIVIVSQETWLTARGYELWIEEVWINYLSNALKYGGRSPRIEVGSQAQDNDQVRFWVRDNGPGLLPEEQVRLFTPFTRLNQVRTKGYGLGLSIVRRIIEKLDGRVGVDSELGVGSTFWFTLPAL